MSPLKRAVTWELWGGDLLIGRVRTRLRVKSLIGRVGYALLLGRTDYRFFDRKAERKIFYPCLGIGHETLKNAHNGVKFLAHRRLTLQVQTGLRRGDGHDRDVAAEGADRLDVVVIMFVHGVLASGQTNVGEGKALGIDAAGRLARGSGTSFFISGNYIFLTSILNVPPQGVSIPLEDR